MVALAAAVEKEGAAPKSIDKEQLTEHELFVAQKRAEATLRDVTCKAVCAIKHGLRQPGAQADGRPAIPANWDTVFKPQLGSFMKFVLGRPDQFRIIEGSGAGFYTVENVAGNRTVVAPEWDKGKGKNGKGKGKGKDGKGKDGKGKGGGKASAKAGTVGAGDDHAEPAKETVRPAVHKTILPRAARLLAHAAKVELAIEVEQEAEQMAAQEEPKESAPKSAVKQESHAKAEMEDDEAEQPEDAGEDGEPAAEVENAAEDTADNDEKEKEGAEPAANDEDVDVGPKHGSLIGSMLSKPALGGLFGRKRPGSAVGTAAKKPAL